MARTPGAPVNGLWPLASGRWQAPPAPGADYALVTTALGHACALSAADLRAAFGIAQGEVLYPPEFLYSPDSGQPRDPRPAAGVAWVPPNGAPALVAERAALPFQGLRRSAALSRWDGLAGRSAQADADARIAPPPPGRHEFFSTRAGTSAHVLLALEPDQGRLFARMPASGRWHELAGTQGQGLAPSGLQRAAWRCELAEGASGSRLLLPTSAGLARVTVDVAALCFELDVFGELPAAGGPMRLADAVWLPLRAEDGRLRLLGVDAKGTPTLLELPAAMAPADDLRTPVSTAQGLVWPCASGRLQLLRSARGEVRAGFLPWPTGLTPCFDFGCPYLSDEGDLWQLCQDEATGHYVYLRLDGGEGEPARAEVDTPRTCSGRATFRAAGRDRFPPWRLAEHADDSRGSQVLLPLLESEEQGAVLGLRMPAADGLSSLFGSDEGVSCTLLLDDPHTTEHEFATLAMRQPWRTRLFIHDGLLWAYHPELRHIDGWRLAR